MPKELKLKCQTLIDVTQLTEDDECIKEYLRSKFIKFYINLYKQQTKTSDDRYLLDIHLFKGSGMVFFDFVKKFLFLVYQSCSIKIESAAEGISSSVEIKQMKVVDILHDADALGGVDVES